MQRDGDRGLEHRVTDVERERAIETLKGQTAAGRLTLEEFSERSWRGRKPEPTWQS